MPLLRPRVTYRRTKDVIWPGRFNPKDGRFLDHVAIDDSWLESLKTTTASAGAPRMASSRQTMSHVGRALPAVLIAPLLMGAVAEATAGQFVEVLSATNPASADYAKTSEFTMLVEDQGILLGEVFVVASKLARGL